MSLYVLDSDILSLFQRGDAIVLSRVAMCSPAEVATTVITIDEQLRGWFTLVRQAKNAPQLAFAYGELARSTSQLSKIQILPFPETAIARFEQLKKAKLDVGANDLRIAAIALEYSATVVTRNIRDFNVIPGLTIEDWSKP
jgi:tRNA(fMet)-specific endonuclease VapC